MIENFCKLIDLGRDERILLGQYFVKKKEKINCYPLQFEE